MNEQFHPTEGQVDPAYIRAVEIEVFGDVTELSKAEHRLLKRQQQIACYD